jgi:hypothetical protein
MKGRHMEMIYLARGCKDKVAAVVRSALDWERASELAQ